MQLIVRLLARRPVGVSFLLHPSVRSSGPSRTLAEWTLARIITSPYSDRFPVQTIRHTWRTDLSHLPWSTTDKTC